MNRFMRRPAGGDTPSGRLSWPGCRPAEQRASPGQDAFMLRLWWDLAARRLPVHVNTGLGDVCDDNTGIPYNMTGLAEKMKMAGYKTHFAGKWDAGMATPAHTPHGRGYDTSLNYFSHKNDFYSQANMQTCCEQDQSLIDFWRTDHGAADVNGTGYSEFLYQKELLSVIEQHDPVDPLFLFYAPHVAHCPLQVPQEYYEKFDFMADDEGLCSQQTVKEEHPIDPAHLELKYQCRRQHAAMIMIMDEVVGNITKALQHKNMWKDTLMIFSSDNGGPVRLAENAANNWPLRGGKYSNFEGGVRVPAFVSGGFVPANLRGSSNSGIIHIADWYATLCHLAGVDPQDQRAAAGALPPIDSLNMWPFLVESKASPREVIPLGENALIWGRWKLLTSSEAPSFWQGPRFPNSTSREPQVLRPPDVDCDDREEWSTFRTAAQRHAQLGWPSQNAELEAMSRALTSIRLLPLWFHYGLGGDGALRVSQLRCGAQAGRLLFLAFVLLGDFFVFDWLYSSSWPVDSLLIMLNVYMVTQGLTTGRPLELLRESAWRPGVDGPAFLRQHSRWSGTSEEWKPRRPAAGSTLRIWQIDSHTALAGEAKTMLTRFGETIGAEVSFQGNSFGGNVCQNYGLCPSAEEKEILQGLLDQYYKHKQAFASVAKSFENVMGPRLSREADVLMCGQPLYWCRFLLGLQKPVFFYEDWEDWAADFAEILLSERHTVIAMSVLTARIIHWQFGTRIPVVRFLGLHTRALYAPVRNDSVLSMRLRVLARQLEMSLTEEALCAEPYGQGHLFADDLPQAYRSSRLQQLNDLDASLPGGLKGYLERARRLLKDAQEGVNPFSGLAVRTRLTPHVPQGANLSGANGPGSAAFAESERLGMKELAKCAFCLVAGGLGERLGFPGIKIGIIPPIKDYFGMSPSQVHIVRQEKVPALLDVDARIAAHDGFIETKPHGHGILCATLGVSAKEGYVMNSVAIPRIPGENIGGICRLVDEKGHSLTLNVEYNQLDPLLKETPTGGDVPDESGFSPFPGNINVLLFNLPAYARCLQQTGGVVPEFVNPKWANSEKTKLKSSTRLESMMQDFPRLCQPGDKVGMTQLDRWIAKTTVKNNLEDARKKVPPECALTAEADIYACNAKLLTLAGDVVIEEPEDGKTQTLDV
eukprot:g13268.t1